MDGDFANEVNALEAFSRTHPDAFIFIIIVVIFLKTGSNIVRAFGCAIADVIKAIKGDNK